MELKTILTGIDYHIIAGDLKKEIQGIYYDSRQVKPGGLFVCITGFKTDGHLFINQAIENGAAAILAERELEVSAAGVDYIVTSNTRQALAIAASNFYHQPSKNLRLIGVTGTNGKTTTTHLIQAILEEARLKTGIMGTLYAKIGDAQKDLGHTTPEAVDIEAFLSLVRKQGGKYVVMEVSSHALDLGRVDTLHFNAAIFTNLTQDHLDYHRDMDQYREAKLKLFHMVPFDTDNFAVINADDPSAEEFIKIAGKSAFTYGINNQADIRAANVDISLKGSRFQVVSEKGSFDINMKLIGMFSIYNALAAIAFSLREGIEAGVVQSALQKVEGVPGRFEQVGGEGDFTVVVDYAHTPDGLENILKTARQIVENRLITVFGCGGDRDRTKRPLMGEKAAKYSDFCVVTSDNPRSEEPQSIISDIVPGLDRVSGSRYAVIVDRREAIRHAIYLAKKGDLVIIAGKGHETYQLVKDQILDFDDRKVAAEFLKERESYEARS